MYPRIAIVSLDKGTHIIFGTYEEYMSPEEAAVVIEEKWPEATGVPISPSDISRVAIVPNDGYPYRFS